ncbi:hypothetical protein ACFS5L_30465 [Streptomyces phyllanthi]|uniref:Uncharacterized protein n=1 Tax=Streptomyces phyllanthi TaxID=1803180 RepID=A0A5N8W327_9ACTN|nr:hypothetical protein [Streptomyces phyllanthi]MPY41907.1 hypothetical protein [Streptomyces phyllanthi]
MKVLASLLPGLRDLRTPLTVGYLWLICGWLWFRDALLRRATARGPIADLYALDGVLPSATFLAALTFIAYFLGSIVELDAAGARWIDPIRPNRASWEAVADRFRIRLDEGESLTTERYAAAIAAWNRTAPSRTAKRTTLRTNVSLEELREEQGFAALEAAHPRGWVLAVDGEPESWTLVTIRGRRTIRHVHWRRSLTGRAVDWRGPELPLTDLTVRGLPSLALAALYALRDELPDLATRLLIERPEVFDKYDRLLAEASIRINMFLPVTVLVSTLALRAHWLWWFGLVMCVALLYQGLVQRSRAFAVVLDSVATRLIESPTMVAVEAAQHGDTATGAPATLV